MTDGHSVGEAVSAPSLGLSDAEFARLNTRILGIAYRMTGSWADAEDIAAKSWLRWHTSRPAKVDEPAAWLTTVATRISLDLWRTAARRREEYIGPWLPEPIDSALLPEETATQRATLELGLLHLMERLTPEERAVYVLRHAFDYPHPEIAAIIGRSHAATRQLGHRAGGKIGEVSERASRAELGVRRGVLNRLVAAIGAGDVPTAVALISDDAVLVTDGGGRVKAALRPIIGADRVIRFLVGIATKSQQRKVAGEFDQIVVDEVEVNGAPGYRFRLGEETRVFVAQFDTDGRIRQILAQSNPDKVRRYVTPG